MYYDVAVIGGGAGGMAAAISAKNQGASVVIIDKNERLGGILNQCIHNGFGLHYFGEELTGTEYAHRFRCLVDGRSIDVLCGTTVMDIDANKKITVVNRKGKIAIQAKAIVYTVGCRERSAGAISLIGDRPPEVMTAGAAQKRINNFGHSIGQKVIILGSGDIGLIMARRMTFEGAKVEKVLEIMPYSSGLKRNIVQCLNDYEIPIEYSTTVTRVVGKRKLEGIYYAKVDEHMNPILDTEKYIECDALLLSIGLIPESEMLSTIGAKINPLTGGAIVNEFRETTVDGVFVCGNALHVHDLVDNVSEEGDIAGYYAGLYATDNYKKAVVDNMISIEPKHGIKYVVPNLIEKNNQENKVKLYFRSSDVFRNAQIIIKSGDKVIKVLRKLILTPGEMEVVEIEKNDVQDDITIEVNK